ncbi:hypothetical protein GWI33_022953 [Rhynchophorus ferrugineus]|uniref:Uncharacterized protein n=1 Tax=Rhynchophorus ferrugineus TaxID=354439 RepID=A0A834M2P4_RHYFE|nr:hypothetical protein GWI33_022953 [Rhynchophorus ferrugineus]
MNTPTATTTMKIPLQLERPQQRHSILAGVVARTKKRKTVREQRKDYTTKKKKKKPKTRGGRGGRGVRVHFLTALTCSQRAIEGVLSPV